MYREREVIFFMDLQQVFIVLERAEMVPRTT